MIANRYSLDKGSDRRLKKSLHLGDTPNFIEILPQSSSCQSSLLSSSSSTLFGRRTKTTLLKIGTSGAASNRQFPALLPDRSQNDYPHPVIPLPDRPAPAPPPARYPANWVTRCYSPKKSLDLRRSTPPANWVSPPRLIQLPSCILSMSNESEIIRSPTAVYVFSLWLMNLSVPCLYLRTSE